MIINTIKKTIKTNDHFLRISSCLYRVFMFNKINKKIEFYRGGVFLNHCKFESYGKNNSLSIGKKSRLYRCTIKFLGNNNSIIIGENVLMRDVELWIEDDGNKIIIGSNSHFAWKAHLACTEGKSICIGEDCLVAGEVVIRTGDTHSILDLNGNRTNNAENISIGTHVWIASRAMILKGSFIPANCIIGCGSIVTKKPFVENSIIAGVPGRTVKNNVDWIKERI